MFGIARASCSCGFNVLRTLRLASFSSATGVGYVRRLQHAYSKVQIGLFDTGRSRPVFKCFWKSEECLLVKVAEKSGVITFAFLKENSQRYWSLQFRLADVKFAVQSARGSVLCFGAAPKIHYCQGVLSVRRLDTSLGGAIDGRLLTTFHHYLVELQGEKAQSLLDILTGEKWRVKLLKPADEEVFKDCTSLASLNNVFSAFQRKQQELQNFSFQVAYQVEHLIARGVLHPMSLAEVFSAVDFKRTDVEDVCAGLQLLPDHLLESLNLDNGLPPLHANSTHLQACMHAAADAKERQERSLFGRGSEKIMSMYSRINDKRFISHWTDKLAVKPPDWRSLQQQDSKKANSRALDLEESGHKRYMMVRRVFVTPTCIKAGKEQLELSNRVVRMHWEHRDRFLRVKFCDESMQWPAKKGETLERIGAIFRNGLDIAGRHYEVLAFSANQVSHGLWCITL